MKRRRDGSPLGPPPQIVPARRVPARSPRVRLTLIRAAPELSSTDDCLSGVGHLDAVAELLALAAGATSVSVQGDALLVAIEHAARALEVLFDRETARRHLARVAEGI